MATYAEKLKFFGETVQYLYDFDYKSRKLSEEIEVSAKKINVSSAYAVVNRMRHTAIEINANVRAILSACDTCVVTLRSNKYNEGGFDELINSTMKLINECTPGTFVIDDMSTSSDGNESMNQSNLDEFVDVITRFTKLAHDTLMGISAARGPMRSENVPMIVNVGKSLEDFTNSIVLQGSAITNQVATMASDYNLEIKALEDATEVLKGINTVDTNPDITFDGDKF